MQKVPKLCIYHEDEKDENLDSVFTSGHNFDTDGHLEESESNFWKNTLRTAKISSMVLIWIVCSCILMMQNEKEQVKHLISIPKMSTKGFIIPEPVITEKVQIFLEGSLLPSYYANLSTNHLHVWVQLLETTFRPSNVSNLESTDIIFVKNISDVWTIPTVSGKLIGTVPEVKHKKTYKLHDLDDRQNYAHYFLKVKFRTNLDANFPVSINYNVQPINEEGVFYGMALLLLLYFLMIFEIVHRSLAAMLASTISIAILAVFNERPALSEIISWMDIETLLLMFSMMTLVAIISETGIFDYTSFLAFKLTGGKVWPLINTLCFFTALLSCFLDNVTTALLMTPVTIRLCEVTKLNPIPVLINMIIYSNIGGALTPIGDPPNVIIASNIAVQKSGITFVTFSLHMSIGVFLSLLVVHLQLRYMYRDVKLLKTNEGEQGLKREIAAWQRVAASMSSYSREENVIKDTILKRSSHLEGMLRMQTDNQRRARNMIDLEAHYSIKDKMLLGKCLFSLVFVIALFSMQNVPAFSKLGLGWTSLLGTLLLLILANRENFESILARVEWSTLLFFASLFVLMEALNKLGLIDWIGQQTQEVVMSIHPQHRLSATIILMMWVSAVASAFVDNIPLTTMMIRIAVSLAENRELNLPLSPLVWALSFGACLGGNGTLFGSSANIICAGVAEQHGYRFSFMDFTRVGFPVAISSLLVTSVYLLLVHVLWQWH